MEWVELVLPAGALADEVAAVLCDDPVAAAGVEVRGEDIVLWARAEDADAALLGLRAAATRLRDHGLDVDPAAVRVRPAAPEDEWRDAWKRHFHVDRVTPRIVIVPSWERYEALPGDVVLDLDPGRAFGTGAHASTRLCLRELDALATAGQAVTRFLDVGTGSGVLSIAAAKLWPDARGRAVDVDPIAVDAARENIERNATGDRIGVSDEDLVQLDGQFDLILANIQADVLELLRDGIVARLAPGGALVLSGLLNEQADPVATLYASLGLDRLRVAIQDDWSAVVLSRRP